MYKKDQQSRITIDLPAETHRKLKAIAAAQGRSMRELVVELIDLRLLAESHKEDKDQCHHTC